uniref:Uncharacterized protein n=1 Tax=Siphoviridae sp. ctkyp1 TaxID=2825646 RepID=A0A8S5P3J1_9CAUD|nr:MAG TPA: hypothetical protein [Siphoviridae sp. ctkyp1]
MKILKSEIDWDKTINIQMTLKEFKLLQDCLFSVSYAELEKLQEKPPYSYDDMQETIKQSETILEQLFCK